MGSIWNRDPPGQTLDVIISRLVGGSHHPVRQVLYHLISANKITALQLKQTYKLHPSKTTEGHHHQPELHLLAEGEVVPSLHHHLHQLAQFGLDLDGVDHITQDAHVSVQLKTD